MPPRPLHALTGLLIAVVVALMGMPATAAAPTTQDSATDPETPLSLTLDEVNTVQLNGSGPITLRGTVTNNEDQAWEDVDIYPVVGNAPITSQADLAEQTAMPETAYVGDRIIFEGDYSEVERIEPGETLDWTIRLPRSDIIDADEPGVYWFGAHAIIPENEAVSIADGRTRTFLPRVSAPEPSDSRGGSRAGSGSGSGTGQGSAATRDRSADRASPQRQISMVVPLRRRVTYAPDGSVADVEQWTEALGPDGRLGRLLAVGQASTDLTWLVDPAVLDAVQRLADGNPARDLGPTDGSPGSETTSPTDDASGSASPTDDGSSAEPTDEQQAAAQRAAVAWLDALPAALSGNEVLALPYADPDLPALAANDPALYRESRERARTVLDELGIPAEPAVAPASGYLDHDALAMLTDNPLVLLSDRAFQGTVPPVIRVEGHRVVTTSSLASAGGPGPGDPLAPVAVRQQAVSVAALGRNDRPVVVLLPDGWNPPAESIDFLRPLQQSDWVTLSPLTRATGSMSAKSLGGDRLVYPETEADKEIEAFRYDVFDALIEAGATLQRLLTHNDQVGEEVLDETLTSMSYAARSGGTEAATASLQTIEALLGRVRVEPPPSVMLSGDSGDFSTTVVNGLDEPITVELQANTLTGMSVTVPTDPLEIPASSTSSFLVRAQASTNGVHPVTLVVTDTEGEPVGQSGTVPIRTGQVSTIIWWFIGVGCGLLFLAIAIRLIRRVRSRGRDTVPESSEEKDRA